MELKYAIQEEILSGLPGQVFQEKLLPFNRRNLVFEAARRIDAAVAILIYPDSECFRFILMKRPEYDGHHSGQISLPGGKFDQADNSLYDTVIRETFEEIGIAVNEQHLVGKLTPIEIAVSGFCVLPFVFFIPKPQKFVLEKSEVEYLILPRLDKLIEPSTIRRTQFMIGSQMIDTPYFSLEGEIVWGATSMMLSEFSEILRRAKIKNPGII